MNDAVNIIKWTLEQAPIIAMFIAMAAGCEIGKIRFGSFRLGNVVGALLAGMAVSLLGVSIDSSVKDVLFALFVFAIGFKSGPMFFRSLGRRTLREVALSVILAGTGLLSVWVVSALFGFNKGVAAGVAAGGLSQSTIVGVAGDALARMNLAQSTVSQYTNDINAAYAVTYVFGTIGPVIFCTNVLPKFMGQRIRDAAIKEEARHKKSMSLQTGDGNPLKELVGRAYKVERDHPDIILESSMKAIPVTIEKIKRNGSFIDVHPEVKLLKGDVLLLAGQKESVISAGSMIGTEVLNDSGMGLVMKTQDVVLTRPEFSGLKTHELMGAMKEQVMHGVYVVGVMRHGSKIDLAKNDELRHGDVLRIYGPESDVKKAIGAIGTPIIPSNKTDIALASVGIIIGFLVGMMTLRIGGIPITLGSGGGVLLSGLFFGWLKGRNPRLGGEVSTSVLEFLGDFGLLGFVAITGIDSGLSAIRAVMSQGFPILLAGMIVTMIPLLISMLAGRYLLHYKNTAVFAGALSGARGSNSAFGQISDEAGNSVPAIPFTVAFALSNVLLTLVGPIVVAIVN